MPLQRLAVEPVMTNCTTV